MVARTLFLAPLLTAGSLVFAAPSASADDRVFEPASEWKQREYDDKCRISRVFGEGEDAVTLWLDQGGSDQNFNLTLLGGPLDKPYGPSVRVQFGDEKELIRSYIKAKSSKGRPVLRMYGLTLVQPELNREGNAERPDIVLSETRIAAIERLTIKGAGLKPFALKLGQMREQFAFLQDCGARLERTLTAASQLLSGVARPAEAIGSDTWLSVSDWPAYLRNAEMEGEITVRLTVNTKGKPSSCSVIGSNKPQLFDDAVCLGLMKRAQFKPARGIGGDPVASYYLYRVTFRFT